MKKMLLGLLLIPIIIGGISIVNASDTSCWSGLGTAPSTTHASGIVYGCDDVSVTGKNIPIITIYGHNGNGDSVGITIKAMNEGTGTVKIGSLNDTGAYGSLYQWGNNYPFPNVADDTIIITSTTRVDTSNYSPGTYSSGTRIKYYYWDNPENKNLRGGSGDEKNGGTLNGVYGYDIGEFKVYNAIDKQAMCPEGYHIPSIGEWNALLYLWSINSNTKYDYRLDVLDYFSQNSAGNKFSEDMLIPFTNCRNQYTTICSYDNLNLFYYWSSTPRYHKDAAHSFMLNSFSSSVQNFDYRGYGEAVRCFKNEYIKIFNVTFLDGNEYVRSGNIESGNTIPQKIITEKNLTGLTKEGYTFSGWITSGSNEMFDVENDVVTTGMTLNAARNINQYTITFDTDGGSVIEPITADYGTGISVPANPTKNGYKFIGWEPEFPTTMPLSGATVKAKWEKLGSSGGGGGRSSKTSSNSEKSTEGQAGNQQPLSPQQASDSSPNREQTVTPLIGGDGEARGGGTQTYTQEFQDAYEFAYEKGITTMPTINEANMNGKLTRIAMAKMLSQYAMNVLGQKPANIVTPKFNDVTDKQNSDYDDGVSLAYQLGIMGQNMPNNKFRPNDEVTRAEFATALSRMAYGTSDGEYKGTGKYYIHHMEKLVKEGIITNDNPTIKELRGYVMIMLKRSAK